MLIKVQTEVVLVILGYGWENNILIKNILKINILRGDLQSPRGSFHEGPLKSNIP